MRDDLYVTSQKHTFISKILEIKILE